MKKILAISGAILLITTFLTVVFLAGIPLGEPQLSVELDPNPPWHMRHATTFDIEIKVLNSAWLLAAARNIRVKVITPPGFSNSLTNLNECELNFGALRGGDYLGSKLTIMASLSVLSGNYNITVIVQGDNVREQILKPQVVVELPYIP